MEKSDMRNILLVDDERNFLTVLVAELRHLNNGLSYLTAENGEKALKVLESVPIHLVVTDIKMPVMDGVALIQQMKSHYPGIPVFAMSSFYPDLEKRLKAMGVLQCVDKLHMDTSTLRNQISELLYGKKYEP